MGGSIQARFSRRGAPGRPEIRYHGGPMRLASVQIGGGEVAAALWAGGAIPVTEVPGPDGWARDLLSLLEGGSLEDLRLRWEGLSEGELDDLSRRAVPAEGLAYAEHAGDLDEAAPAEEPASFMRPD